MSGNWQLVSTFCNHPHRLRDGKPVGHECYVIPPAALKAEMVGEHKLARHLIEAAKPLSLMRKGVKS